MRDFDYHNTVVCVFFETDRKLFLPQLVANTAVCVVCIVQQFAACNTNNTIIVRLAYLIGNLSHFIQTEIWIGSWTCQLTWPHVTYAWLSAGCVMYRWYVWRCAHIVVSFFEGLDVKAFNPYNAEILSHNPWRPKDFSI